MSEGTEVTVTQDAGSVAAESTTVPETGAESSASSSAAGASPTGRTYRDEDVQRIVRERLAAERRAHEKKFGEVQSKLTQYEGHYQKLAEAEYARARALGYVQDEQPKYLTEKDVDSRFEKLRGEWKQEQQHLEQSRLMNRIKGDFEVAKREAGDWAEMPGFKEAFAGKWDGNTDPKAIVREMVSHYEKRLAARQNQVATTKEATLKSAPVKGGGGTRSASAAESGGPLRKQIMAQLKSSRGG
jgi:hypothetical protein